MPRSLQIAFLTSRRYFSRTIVTWLSQLNDSFEQKYLLQRELIVQNLAFKALNSPHLCLFFSHIAYTCCIPNLNQKAKYNFENLKNKNKNNQKNVY